MKNAQSIRKLYSKPFLIILLIIIILLIKGTWGVYLKEQESRGNAAMVKVELVNLEERKALLEIETKKLKSQEGIEEAIRKKFQVSKPGENVLVVVDKPLPASSVVENQNFFSKMWESVSGIFKKNEEQNN